MVGKKKQDDFMKYVGKKDKKAPKVERKIEKKGK